MGSTTRITLTVNTEIYKRYLDLNEQFKEIFGSKMVLSPIVTDVVRAQVELMESMLEKYKKGKLTPESMLEYYFKRVAEETREVKKEAMKVKSKS